MIKIQINEVLEQKGCTLYWLAKEAGLRYATVWNMAKGDQAKLHLDALDRICEVLACQPGDLFIRVEKDAKKRKQLSRKRAVKTRQR
jgi:putative transcriptional regulator